MPRYVTLFLIPLMACSSSGLCGNGSRFDAENGAQYCVYESGLVVEGGFRCPTGLSQRIDAGRHIVCARSGGTAQELPEELCRRYSLSCERAQPDPDAGRIDGGVDSGRVSLEPCADTDGDGLPDLSEFEVDVDEDGLSGVLDTDSDGDGLTDGQEAGPPRERCDVSLDCDRDGYPNHADRDSDNDGIEDAEEAPNGFDVCAFDSDGDGCPDSIELQGCQEGDVSVAALGCGSGIEVVAPVDSSRVTLVLDDPAAGESGPVIVFARQAVPDAGATREFGGVFSDVVAGTRLEFGILVVGFSTPPVVEGNPAMIPWRLLGASDEVLKTGRLFVMNDTVCFTNPI